MAKAFRNSARGITGSLHQAERKILRELFDDIIHMLEQRAEVHRLPDDIDPLFALTGIRPAELELPPITDAALKKLLPDASLDPEAAAEHRRLTEADLITDKLGRLREAQFLLEGEKIVLDQHSAPRFAQALNDVRLVLAERLEIRDEQDSQRISQMLDAKDVTSPDEYLALIYNLVSWLQDTLMSALLDAQH